MMQKTPGPLWIFRRATGLGALAWLMATSCDTPPEAGEGDPVGGEIESVVLAQAKQDSTSCTDTGAGLDDVPTKFIENCLLWGGEIARCSGGVAECCKSGVDDAGDSYEHCTTSPRVGPGGVDIAPVTDLVLDTPPPPPPRFRVPTNLELLAP